ncbi:MAG: ribosomal RNA small subunit methyltransferase A [Bacteroidetes bacterium]|nr:ribosomal RNA small subunit methyltransferase A [Bacteroidota bacterium]
MQRFETKKSLGQHFLFDENILRRIADACDVREGESVIEIGPGTGALTRHLLHHPLSRLIAFELDDRAVDVLEREIADPRFEVVHTDFLKTDLQNIAPEARLNVVGNIPYYITSPIVFKLLEERTIIRSATLLVQLEVGERLVAVPRTKQYGIPSVISQCFADVKMLFKVKAGAFRPPPNVDSAVVRLDFTNDYFARSNIPPPANFTDKQFSRMVRTLFSMRRKTIKNNLKALGDTGADAAALEPYLPKRAEELDVAEMVKLYSILYP